MSMRQYLDDEIEALARSGCQVMHKTFKGKRMSYDTFASLMGVTHYPEGDGKPLPRTIMNMVLDRMADLDNTAGRRLASARVVSVNKSKPKEQYGRPSSGFERNVTPQDLSKFKDLEACIEYHMGDLTTLEIL
jgi:hypothetical protein